MAEETKHIQFSKSGVDQIQLKIPAMAEKEEINSVLHWKCVQSCQLTHSLILHLFTIKFHSGCGTLNFVCYCNLRRTYSISCCVKINFAHTCS